MYETRASASQTLLHPPDDSKTNPNSNSGRESDPKRKIASTQGTMGPPPKRIHVSFPKEKPRPKEVEPREGTSVVSIPSECLGRDDQGRIVLQNCNVVINAIQTKETQTEGLVCQSVTSRFAQRPPKNCVWRRRGARGGWQRPGTLLSCISWTVFCPWHRVFVLFVEDQRQLLSSFQVSIPGVFRSTP